MSSKLPKLTISALSHFFCRRQLSGALSSLAALRLPRAALVRKIVARLMDNEAAQLQRCEPRDLAAATAGAVALDVADATFLAAVEVRRTAIACNCSIPACSRGGTQ